MVQSRLEQNSINGKSQERPRIVKAIAEAREQGCVRTKSMGYAKEEQFYRGRIHDLEELECCRSSMSLRLQAQVKLYLVRPLITCLSNDEKISYQIVGDEEADIKANKLSVYSPIGRALIGKEEGAEVLVETLVARSSMKYLVFNTFELGWFRARLLMLDKVVSS